MCEQAGIPPASQGVFGQSSAWGQSVVCLGVHLTLDLVNSCRSASFLDNGRSQPIRRFRLGLAVLARMGETEPDSRFLAPTLDKRTFS